MPTASPLTRSRLLIDFRALLLVPLSLSLSGCGGHEGPQRVAVRGSVQFGAAPLESGQVRFVPQAPTTGPASAAAVVDGEYAFTEADGPVVGTHRIEIESAERFDFPVDDEQAFAKFAESREGRDRRRPVNPVPEIYNTKSTLTRTVESEGEPVFDFVLDEAQTVTNR